MGTIQGRTYVRSRERTAAAPGVIVRLISGKDTLFTQSSGTGAFSFRDVLPGRKRLLASGIQYRPTLMEVNILPGNNAFLIELAHDEKTIFPAFIVGDIPPVTQHGDTLVFNPAAVKVMEGESALEILRSMPGVEMREGVIYVNGQRVERTYVNGLLLFGDEPLNSLNALLAEDVRQIRSYEELSIEDRMRGNKNGKKERVLDVRTKEAIVSAFDAYAQAAGGADGALKKEENGIKGRYFGGLNANFFSERFLAYLNASANNLGLMQNTLGILSETKPITEDKDNILLQTGVEKYWGDRLLGSHAKFFYALDRNINRSFSRTWEERMHAGDNPSRTLLDSTDSQNNSLAHRIRVDIIFNHEKWKNWSYSTDVSISGNEYRSHRINHTVSAPEVAYYTNETQGGSAREWNWFQTLGWKNNYAKGKVSPFVTVSSRLGSLSGDEWTKDTLLSSPTRRYLSIDKKGDHTYIRGDLGMTIRLRNSEKGTSELDLSYGANYENECRQQIAVDMMGPEGYLAEPIANLTNTYSLTRDYLAQGLNLNYSFSSKEWRFFLYSKAEVARQSDKKAIPSSLTGEKWFFLPSLETSLRYGQWEWKYKLRSQIPAIEQYRDWLDDRTTRYLSAGNPALRRPLFHSAQVDYSIPFVKQAAFLRLSATCSYAQDAIVTQTTFFQQDTWLEHYNYKALAGSTLSSFENSEGTWDAGVSALFNRRFRKLGTSLTLTGTLIRFCQRPQFVAQQKLMIREVSPGARVSVQVRPDKHFQANLSLGCDYHDSWNSANQPVLRYIESHASLRTQYHFLKYGTIQAAYQLTHWANLTGRTGVLHQNLRAALGVRLWKGRLVIEVSGNDLLNGGSGYTLMTGPDYRAETWTPSFGRFFLLSAVFRINKLQSSTRYAGQLSNGSRLSNKGSW